MILGVTLQSNLKWTKHTQQLQQKLKNRLSGLIKVRFIISYPFRKTLAEGIFTSILTYCIAAWHGGCWQRWLTGSTGHAEHVVLNLPPRTHRDTMYSQLGWLTINQLVFFHSVMAVYKIRKSQEPEYLASLLCQDNIRKNIIIPHSTLTLAKKSFCYRSAESWNIVPEQIRSLEKIESFKRELKKWTLMNIERFL